MSPASSPVPEHVPADEVEIVGVGFRPGSQRRPRPNAGGFDPAFRPVGSPIRVAPLNTQGEIDGPSVLLRGTVHGGTPESRLRLAAEAIAEAINEDVRVRRERAEALAVKTSIERAARRVRELLAGTTLDPD